MDDSGLSNCVVFSCTRPAANGAAYCTQHMSLIPAPSPPAPVDDTPLPDPAMIPPALERPEPPLPDMAALEPRWDGTQWVLKPKRPAPDRNLARTLENVRGLVRELVAELDIWEDQE